LAQIINICLMSEFLGEIYIYLVRLQMFCNVFSINIYNLIFEFSTVINSNVWQCILLCALCTHYMLWCLNSLYITFILYTHAWLHGLY